MILNGKNKKQFAAQMSWVRSPGQTFVTFVSGNMWGKSCTGRFTLKNVLDLIDCQSQGRDQLFFNSWLSQRLNAKQDPGIGVVMGCIKDM